ncbi:geranylgeranyl pyrophosphate synthase [Natronospira proteinivora]|uniref:Geranylgeranyl pyrophosphate synthase n=1 Tax=Natronospira proteinivora TaxID=1807133 RepID=A0ABT1GB53_9GAMM|nr:farnesyl diphosphate synthase [Natronospira proteinivora]MCP1727132.1 geranylgeranyl pyrophosphate synthase [Natronospira proteinivora]
MANPTDSSTAGYTVEGHLNRLQARIETQLSQCLPESPSRHQLLAAMDYGLTGGGKRLRPLLVYAAGALLDAPQSRLDTVALSVEMIHAYSLIHDDLPAMDDDDLRRGRPTCHLAFDEATAILAGDALQSEAFRQLAGITHPDPARPARMIALLAEAAGPLGMAGGQALDLALTGGPADEAALTRLHEQKTGALIAAALQLGGLAADEIPDSRLDQLGHIGRDIGLAFQIQDDVLDATTNTEVLGKRQGADAARAHPTFTSLLGTEEATRRYRQLYAEALSALAPFGQRSELLAGLIDAMMQRSH